MPEQKTKRGKRVAVKSSTGWEVSFQQWDKEHFELMVESHKGTSRQFLSPKEAGRFCGWMNFHTVWTQSISKACLPGTLGDLAQ